LLACCGRLNFGYPIVPCEEISASASALVNDVCYTRHDTPTSWLIASGTCYALGGYSVTIMSSAENDALATLPVTTPAWFGMRSKDQANTWEWNTGEPLVYANWAQGQPMYCGATAETASLYLADGTWSSACVTEGHPFLCEIPPWLVDEETHHAYRTYWGAEDWFGAANACRGFGGHLATITSLAEQRFVSQIIFPDSWIGASAPDGVSYAWETGEPFSFAAWIAGEPNPGGMECVTVTAAQVWQPVACSDPHAALCEIE